MQPEATVRIMKALEMIMSTNTSVSRSLQTIKRYSLTPERIDAAILAAINASLCIASVGNDQVAEGFNDDIARNGRNFGRQTSTLACA
jgi:cell division protein ZapA (FtsZ GTPase activity inhibitor)